MANKKEYDETGANANPTSKGGGYTNKPLTIMPKADPDAWIGAGGFGGVPMVAAPPSLNSTYYLPYHGMGTTTPSMVEEFGPQSAKVFENLGVLTQDPRAQREAMRQQTAAQAGQAMAGIQRHAARGGAALRGAATGAGAAQVARGIVVPGEIQAEAAFLETQQRNAAQLGAAMNQTIETAMAYSKYDDGRKIVAKTITDETLAKVSENIGDPEFDLMVQQAFKQYWLDIANGMDPVVAALRFDSMVTSGLGGFGAQTASGEPDPEGGFEPEATQSGTGIFG